MNTDHLSGEQSDRGETVICACLHRTEAEIRSVVARLGLETFEDVAAAVLAGSGCTTCRPEIETILGEVRQAGLQTGLQTGLPENQGPGEPGDLPENVDGEQAATPSRGRVGGPLITSSSRTGHEERRAHF